jgi:nitrite reductase/ring-hydroxylating ferredoxin subunit
VISRRIFADPEVFTLEQDRIFGRGWFFVGHETEIPNPGDVLTRQCGLDPVLFLRDQNGVVRVFLNSCRHRGMRLLRTDRDNLRLFRCPYHGWSYGTNGELLAASSEHHYCDGELDKTQLGLIPVALTAAIAGSFSAAGTRAVARGLARRHALVLDIIFSRTGGIGVRRRAAGVGSQVRGNSRPTISRTLPRVPRIRAS